MVKLSRNFFQTVDFYNEMKRMAILSDSRDDNLRSVRVVLRNKTECYLNNVIALLLFSPEAAISDEGFVCKTWNKSDLEYKIDKVLLGIFSVSRYNNNNSRGIRKVFVTHGKISYARKRKFESNALDSNENSVKFSKQDRKLIEEEEEADSTNAKIVSEVTENISSNLEPEKSGIVNGSGTEPRPQEEGKPASVTNAVTSPLSQMKKDFQFNFPVDETEGQNSFDCNNLLAEMNISNSEDSITSIAFSSPMTDIYEGLNWLPFNACATSTPRTECDSDEEFYGWSSSSVPAVPSAVPGVHPLVITSPEPDNSPPLRAAASEESSEHSYEITYSTITDSSVDESETGDTSNDFSYDESDTDTEGEEKGSSIPQMDKQSIADSALPRLRLKKLRPEITKRGLKNYYQCQRLIETAKKTLCRVRIKKEADLGLLTGQGHGHKE